MCERGYAILLWYDDSVVGIYTVVRSMERVESLRANNALLVS